MLVFVMALDEQLHWYQSGSQWFFEKVCELRTLFSSFLDSTWKVNVREVRKERNSHSEGSCQLVKLHIELLLACVWTAHASAVCVVGLAFSSAHVVDMNRVTVLP